MCIRDSYGIAKDMEKAALRQYKHVIALTDIDRLLLADLVGQECNIYAVSYTHLDVYKRQYLPSVFR